MTHIRRALALALAAALACACLPAAALAKTAVAEFGIALEVPSQAFVDPGDGSDVRAAEALVGIRVEVPKQAFVEPGDGSAARAASGTMGIRLEVPTQSYVDPGDGSDVRAASGLMGIRLEVPTQSFVDPGDGSDVRAAEGMFGIRIEVPKQAFVDPGDGDDVRAADGLVGIRLKVPSQAYVDPGDGEDVRAAAALTGIRLAVPGDDNEKVFYLHAMGEGARLADEDAEGYALDASDPADPVYAGKYGLTEGKVLPTPTRPGHDFAGWYAGWSEDGGYAGEPVAAVDRAEQGNPHFWAKWEEESSEVDTYTVTFDSRGGSAVAPQEVEQGETATAPKDPVRQGFDFKGWYKDVASARALDSSGLFDFAGTPIERDTTVYAGWEKRGAPIGERHTVTFDARGGTKVPSQTVTDGGFASAPAAPPTKDGWKFAGWYATAEGAADLDESALFDFGATRIEADTTVYAGWKELERFKVTFYAAGGQFENAGEGGVDLGVYTIQVREGDTVPADQVPRAEGTAVAAPKQAGWQFADWYPEKRDGSGDGQGEGDYAGEPFDFANTPVTLDVVGEDGELAVYAKWTLRLDVTVPVEVGFAVDAGSREATTPDAGRYAIKSRTVREVSVESLATVTHEAEVKEFFSLAEPPEGGDLDGWHDALAGTVFSVADAAGADRVDITLADGAAPGKGYGPVLDAAGDPVRDEDGAAVKGWTHGAASPFRIGAFDYAGGPYRDEWWKADACERLGLKLDLTIPASLEVRTDLDGPKPVTHLRVTVSARE